MIKTFYLWDLANTLFPEKWNKEKSGFESYNAYVKSLGYDLKTISPKDYEWSYKMPYKQGLFDLNIAKGYKEVLSWTKNNFVFTTGNKEQIDWRAEYLNPKVGFDIREYLTEIYSTFDYGNTNVKTIEMVADILGKKHKEGFTTAVYTDDKPANCEFFLKAVDFIAQKGVKLKARTYHIRNDSSEIKKINERYYEIGNLLQLLENEKIKTNN